MVGRDSGSRGGIDSGMAVTTVGAFLLRTVLRFGLGGAASVGAVPSRAGRGGPPSFGAGAAAAFFEGAARLRR
ncbi:MAG: hypothetical protein ACLP74_08065 [Thermoplasmata archaeon]